MPPKHPSRFLAKPLTSRFSQGYGDFVMQSSDNMLLYFPKFLLGHASPFFKDLFDIAQHASHSSSADNSQPLVMEEDLATLEDLLSCIDPSKSMPPINLSTIAKVLRAAHKYQIEKFIDYFASVVGQESTCACTVPDHGSFLSTEPMLILFFAEQYDLPNLARLALRQLIVEPMDKFLASNPAINLKMWRHLLRLRKQRTEWFLAYIGRSGQWPPYKNGGRVCSACHTSLMECARQVHDSPRWSSVEAEVSAFTKCQRCWKSPVNSASVSVVIVQLEKDAKNLETALPRLPKDVLGGSVFNKSVQKKPLT